MNGGRDLQFTSMSTLRVNLDLVRKYNVAGPRYTSYPPATRFSEDFSWPALADEIIENNRTKRDLSLYFHIPFCQSLCWYCGCTTVITTKSAAAGLYLEFLEQEIAQTAAVLNPKRKVTQLHFGGGTPTFLSPEQLRRLGRMIHEQFTLADDVEASVEIDPRRLTSDHVAALREIGFNRASVGVQDFNSEVQTAVHRIQPREQTEQAIEWLRAEGFKSVNIDLIYGLPFQTVATFEKTLDAILELAPARLAVFSYAHVPWLKPAQKILENALPTPEDKLQILKLTANNRYAYIGMDHFARPDDELARAQATKTLRRNFQGYSTGGDTDIYSFGMSSISQTENAYWQNHKDIVEYYGALRNSQSPVHKAYLVTEDDKIRRETILRLMCDLSLDYNVMSEQLGIDFKDYFAEELESLDPLEADELIVKTAGGIEITPQGRLLIRNIVMRFDAYLPQERERRFSKTI
jgi:oxygen-independent coproporphyrinogen III oxidase